MVNLNKKENQKFPENKVVNLQEKNLIYFLWIFFAQLITDADIKDDSAVAQELSAAHTSEATADLPARVDTCGERVASGV